MLYNRNGEADLMVDVDPQNDNVSLTRTTITTTVTQTFADKHESSSPPTPLVWCDANNTRNSRRKHCSVLTKR